jgi:hypothetical protein
MRIEAVTVCVDYADFLEVTLASIRMAVDDLVVVTCPEDVRTQRLCNLNGVRTVVTDAMHRDHRAFSLGAGIDAGLKALPLTDWALVVDADIVLPRNFHRTVQYLRLDPAKLYGIDRVHCRGRAAWDRFDAELRSVRTFEAPFLRDFPVGARIQLYEAGGYLPCGYFQLWNAGATGYRDYPIHPAGTAEASDLMFSHRFPRQYRELIPEIVAIELGTDSPGDVGVNWSGRRTPEFSIEGGPYRR